MKTAGIALIVVGLLMIAYTGFNFVTKEKVVDIGSVQITKDKDHTIQWSPILGAVLLVGGIVMLATGKKSA